MRCLDCDATSALWIKWIKILVMSTEHRRYPLRMLGRIFYLLAGGSDQSASLVRKSYDRISGGYDTAWTTHMRGRSDELVEKLGLQKNDRVVDLTCGTGYVTGKLAEKTGGLVTGVDSSAGMLERARDNCRDNCDFAEADILEYLKRQPAGSIDVVACCWGLGYSRPFAVLEQVRRVLRPGGKAGIIDNSIFSLAEVFYCSVLAFAERPEKLKNIMRFRFLMNSRQLELYYRIVGLKPRSRWDGAKSYYVNSGSEAIERLTATGAAAGFEYASDDEAKELIFDRFGQIIEDKYLRDGKIKITHRYLGGIAVK